MADGAVFLTFTLDIVSEALSDAPPRVFGAFELAPGTEAPSSLLAGVCHVDHDAWPVGERPPATGGPWVDGPRAPGTQAPLPRP